MSEYQRYEFMTIDRPLTPQEMEEVEDLSSHIEVSATSAIVEYNYGDFKYDPIEVLHNFFDGFLYWANWGSPQLALRFPHGILSLQMLNEFDFDEFVTFTTYADYDILDIHFPELEAPDGWTEYTLGSMIPIRDELMAGDLRSLYIAWLAVQQMIGIEDEEGEENDVSPNIFPIPPNFKKLTSAHHALADLLQVDPVLLAAAARHSETNESTVQDDFPAWIERLPQERRNDYLLRLANNEPGLSRQLVYELRELGNGKQEALTPTGERISYPALLAEGRALKVITDRERREEAERARLRRLQSVYERREEYWHNINQGVERKNSAGYDEALQLLLELRDAMKHFNEGPQFQARFQDWIRAYPNRPAFIKRLTTRGFTIPRS